MPRAALRNVSRVRPRRLPSADPLAAASRMRTVPAAIALALVLVACGDGESAGPGTGGIFERSGAAPALPLEVAPDLVIRDARFGLLQPDAAGDEHFLPATELPAVDGTAFGWVLEVETGRDRLAWRETLRLPEAPADWGDAAADPDVAIAADGRSVTARGVAPVTGGTVSRFYWALASGDPAGEYVLEVVVEDRPVARFRFRVPAPVRERPVLVRHAPAGPAQSNTRTVAWK